MNMLTNHIHGRLRLLLSAAALAAALLLALGCGSSEKPAAEGPVPLKVAYSPGVCNAAIFVAYENGYFNEEGLDVEMVQVDAAHISDAVGSGQVDAFQGMAAKLVQPLENGLPVKAVSGIHTGCQKVLVRGDSPIQSLSDLKGKTIGVPGLADAGTILVKRALHNEGIGVTDKDLEVEFRVFDRNDLPQALEKGAVDAITASDPVGPIMVQQSGYRVLLDNAKDVPFADEYCCLAFVTDKLAKENPKAAASFVRAINRAALWVQQHPREAAQLELDKKYVAGDIDLNTRLIESYNYTPSVQGGYDAIRNIASELAYIGLISPKTDAENFAKAHTQRFEGVPDTPEQ